MDVAETQNVDLGRALRILWSNAWIVILLIVLAAGGTYAWAKQQHRVFQATALVRAFDPASASGSSGTKIDPTREVDIQVLFAKSQVVVSDFHQRMGSNLSHISGQSITAVTNADALSIAVKGNHPKYAQSGALAYAEAYIAQQRKALADSASTQAAALRSRASSVQSQLNALDAEITKLQPTDGSKVSTQGGKAIVIPETERLRNLSLQRNDLAQKYADLVDQADQAQAQSTTQQADVDFVQQPTLPTSPVSPRTKMDVLIAAIAGLFLGLIVIVVRTRLRGRIVTAAELKQAVPELTFVVPIPAAGRATQDRKGVPHLEAAANIYSPLAESYRSLNAWLRLGNPGNAAQVVMVTSALAAEGKTTVVTNLAVSLAQAGERVLVVDCDLRHANVHEVFALPNNVGYSSAVLNPASLNEAITPVSIRGGSLDVMAAGPRAPEPTQVLLLSELGTIFGQLRARYSYILVDSSPVLPVADTLTIVRAVDQVLVVARAGQTPASGFSRAVDSLRQFGAPLQGAALVGARHEPVETAYGYYPGSGKGKRKPARRQAAPARQHEAHPSRAPQASQASLSLPSEG